MKFYAVYMKPDSADALESVRLVPQKFSWMAAIFQGLWALYHRLWWMAAVLIAVNLAFGYLDQQAIVGPEVTLILNLAIFAIVGFWAPDWLEADLLKKHYVLMEVVACRDETEAKHRFLSALLSKKIKHVALPEALA